MILGTLIENLDKLPETLVAFASLVALLFAIIALKFFSREHWIVRLIVFVFLLLGTVGLVYSVTRINSQPEESADAEKLKVAAKAQCAGKDWLPCL
jgi:hypothetical protein